MEKCIGLISTSNMDNKFGQLCKHRPPYMLPFGGRYRLIDFSISNLVNHGIGTVAIYTGEKIRSTMDHLGNGKPWDLNRRFNGLFLFPPVYDDKYKQPNSDIAQYHSTESFFKRGKEKYIFIMHPNILAKVNISEVFRYFVENNADATLIYHKRYDPFGEYVNCSNIHMDKEGNLIDIGLNLGTKKTFNHYLGMAFVKKDVFMEIIRDTIENGDSYNLIDAMLNRKKLYKINSYEFKGHVEVIRDLKSYYEANLNLLKREISQELFFNGGTIYTKTKDEPSTFYSTSSNVQHSLVANGCIIEGNVEGSVIFRGVKIGKNAIVKNSIIMQKSVIEDGAVVVNSILDKYSRVAKGASIAGSSLLPYVVEKYGEITKD
ncbi:MAG: glucose-1-phosphate adenylyltransferase subunit GlgD [Tissierellaceae bacterium]|nr:glucose-1-phosphate adenylyltransferase subunit GlgD [Tissierellaceae bacterium]